MIKLLLTCLIAFSISIVSAQTFRIDSLKICHQNKQLQCISATDFKLAFREQNLVNLYFKDSIFYYDIDHNQFYITGETGNRLLIRLREDSIFNICNLTSGKCTDLTLIDKSIDSKASSIRREFIEGTMFSFHYQGLQMEAVSVFDKSFGTLSLYIDAEKNRITQMDLMKYFPIYTPGDFIPKIKIKFRSETVEIQQIGFYEGAPEEGLELLKNYSKNKPGKFNVLRYKALANNNPELFKYQFLVQYDNNGEVKGSSLPLVDCECE